MKQENKIENYIKQNNLEMSKVVDDYYHYISTIIKNTYSLSAEDQEEIISDVFFIIWKNRSKLDRNAKFSPYIAGITKKVIYKKYSEQKGKIVLTQQEEIVDIYDINYIIEQQEIHQLINDHIQDIGYENYEIFIKFYYEDKKVKQIAQDMNLSISNVKTKLHRTRRKIREILEIGGFKR